MTRLLTSVRRGAGTPGLLAALAVVVVQRLLHGALHDAPFAPYSAAEWVIRSSPGPVATYMIDSLGHRAQILLSYSVIAGVLVLGYLLGRRPAWMLAAVAFVLTLVAAYLSPLARSVEGAFLSAGVAALTAFLAQYALRSPPARPVDAAIQPEAAHWGRRRFLARVGVGVVLVAVGGAAFFRAGSRSTPMGPVLADRPAIIPPDPSFAPVPGISPRINTAEEHYVVDINIENPLLDSSWRLKIDGAVRAPLSFSLADLQTMNTKERINNLTCISNKVGGNLIGNSRWTGVSLDELLDMAGVTSAAITLVAHADDGFTDGIRLEEIRGKDAMIAFGMNGRTIPRDHGYPARLLFPDHFGMRNVKWLTRLELKTEDEEGYWAKRGWDREAVVRTQSRIDAPRSGDTVDSTVVCCGIAWAGARRIQQVEVSTDDGRTWQPAQLEAELGPLSWRRWQAPLDLPPGEHTLVVRATDGTGTPQDEEARDPHPSGASGYHRITVTVQGA